MTMNCEKIRELAADYLNGDLRGGEKEAFLRHLSECSGCRSEIEEMEHLWETMDTALDEEPGPDLERKFNSMLQAYSQGSREASRRKTKPGKAGLIPFAGHPALQAAAVIVLVALGVLLGREMEHGKMKDMEIAFLRQEVTNMREMVTVSLMTQSSAIDRLQGVSMSREVGIPNDRLLDTLIKTLDSDPDVNVRMAAVDALGRYGDRERVRKALVSSLEAEQSPLVQVSLIDLLVQLREPGAKPVLKSIIDDKNTLEPVKKRARTGLEKLI